ncbi:MAG: riboflavin synthase [Deltaproteobacteria bacterium]|nr:riboflavin synthase [Deltaproteobacteria bacterium]
MFTGIVEHVGRIARVVRVGSGARLRIDAPYADLALGESVAVSGVCLTVAAREPGWFEADASAETLARSTLASAVVSREVNLERALAVGARLGGHVVTGHVDGVGRLVDRRALGELGPGAERMRFEMPRELARFVAGKGSIAIDGVSLTVNEVGDDWLQVVVVPFTQSATTLARLLAGATVNLEVDVLAKYVVRALSMGAPRETGAMSTDPTSRDGVTLEALRRAGYL